MKTDGKTCPKCGSNHTEMQAESGEWWWYCYACDNDWGLTEDELRIKP